MTTPLDDQSVIAYMQSRPELRDTLFADGEPLVSEALTEGNVNLVYRVYSRNDPQNKSVILKQALPHSWRYPDFKMPVERSRIECEVLTIESKYSPEQTVRLYFHDPERHINAFEDLNRHLVMRDGLARGNVYPRAAEHIGTFLARSLFYTSDFYLSSAEKKALVARFTNPVMVKVQEDLVFSQPFHAHPNNRVIPGVERQVEHIYQDEALHVEILRLKEKYMTNAQALLHNDLHTGSVLLNTDETKVIDPEFAFFGPMAHDIGSYLANLAIAYAAQEFHAKMPDERAAYRSWLASSLEETWLVLEWEFLNLWEEKGNGEWQSDSFRRDYMAHLLQDATAFGAAEIFRRLIGLAHVSDLWTITDEQSRAQVTRLGLQIAYAWIHGYRQVESVAVLGDLLRNPISAYP